MHTRTIHFTQHWGYAKASVACRSCGAISKRNIKEYCTVNPFNKNEDGTVCTTEQVKAKAWKRAEEEAARQVAEGRICRKCEKK